MIVMVMVRLAASVRWRLGRAAPPGPRRAGQGNGRYGCDMSRCVVGRCTARCVLAAGRPVRDGFLCVSQETVTDRR